MVFQVGNTHGKGRKQGSRNKFSQAFVDAVAEDFYEHGKGVIKVLRTEDPAAYIRTCVSLVPKDFQISGRGGEALFTGITLERVTTKNLDSCSPP